MRTHPTSLRRSILVLAVCSLTGLGLTATASAGTGAPRTRTVGLFPSNTLTVRDPHQLTGRRVALPLPDCTTQPTTCNDIALIDQLDGFDLDPRLALTFSGPVDPALVARQTGLVEQGRHASGRTIGVDRVVYDSTTHTVYAHPRAQLAPGTTYRLTVRGGAGVTGRSATFTTESATAGLLAMRRQLDDGSAYAAAGITGLDRRLRIEHVFPAAGTTLAYTTDNGTQRPMTTASVPNTSAAGVGYYVFGSYLAPSWLAADSSIAQTPTRGPGPQVTGQARLPFALLLPVGRAPRGGWPVAIFGHGFTSSDQALFLAADFNATKGFATIATDVVGHGGGPRSTWDVTSGGVTTSFSAYARGRDQNGDGTITSTEGVATPIEPAAHAAIQSRDGLRQTTADIMSLVRAIGRGVDINGAWLKRTDVAYYGQSFGGIYGVMLGGVDPKIPVLAPNVSGGPISEIIRLSPEFRPLVEQDLALRQPPLLNGGIDNFTESMPLRGQPPVTDPAPGAIAIQQAIADETWLARSGSPETFAPLLRRSPPPGSHVKRVLFQNAYGDQTVPNPTTYTELHAGNLFDRDSLYRNDKTAQAAANPHTFLLDPAFAQGSAPGQLQIITFFATGGRRTIDPDGPGPVWEKPIADRAELLTLNFTIPAGTPSS